MDNIENLINKITIINNDIERYRLEKGVDQTMKEMGCEFDNLCEELAKTGDSRGLLYLLDYFNDDFDLNNEGVLEWIQNNIGANFSLEQILEAFYKKFDQLATKNVARCVYISYWFLSHEMFKDFRRMFNTVKSNASEKFLDRLDAWADEDYPKERKILREDMKKW